MSSTSPLVSVLMVTHNNADVLPACLDSLAACPPSCEWEVVAVDNGSADGTAAILADRFPWVTLVDNTANLGFAAGNMRAAGAARGDLLLLLNPDTVVMPGALDALIEALLARESVWVAGACLLKPDGSFNTSWSELPSVGWALASTAPWGRLGIRVRSRRKMGCGCEGLVEPTRVGSVSGAAFLVGRSAWEELGGLHDGYFMYFEETEFCRRVHDAGREVIVVPASRIVHLEGASVGQASTRQRVWFTESLLRYFRRNESVVKAVTVTGWVLLVNATLLIASYPVGVFSARVRGERPRYAALARVALGRRVGFDERGMVL